MNGRLDTEPELQFSTMTVKTVVVYSGDHGLAQGCVFPSWDLYQQRTQVIGETQGSEHPDHPEKNHFRVHEHR